MPLQTIGEPSAVRRRTPSEESDLGPGSTETEAPESTKNSRSDRISLRNRREKLHNSGSGTGFFSGSDSGFILKKLAGWKGSSTCLTASFPNPGRVSYSADLCLHVSCDTNMDLEKMENARIKQV